MRRYEFDHKELKKLLTLAFKHGYKEGIYDSNPMGLPDHDGKAQWELIDNADSWSETFSVGAILDGRRPSLYEWKDGNVVPYMDEWHYQR